MKSVAIVILNYEAYRETEKCVDSILDKKLDVSGIVIVDNASENDSLTYLTKKYRHNNRIKLVKCSRNLGFAKGNNIGIKVAKNTWGVDFVLLLNSDTVILEEDYIIKMLDGYRKGIGVIQTSALRMNGRYTQKNYGAYKLIAIVSELIINFCSYFNIYCPSGAGIISEKTLGPWVSGCDILLTPDFFETFRGLYPLTFLYGEEYILAIMLKKAGMQWEIIEDAHILHAESRSTPLDIKEGTWKKKGKMLIAGKNKVIVRIMPLWGLRWIINRGEW